LTLQTERIPLGPIGRNRQLKNISIDGVLAQQALQRAPVFPGGFGCLGDVPMVLREQVRNVVPLELADYKWFRLPQTLVAQQIS
jgi:hypothetical protein